MGNDIIFDTLQYAKKLKTAGVPEKQAEVHAEAMAELVDNKLATKQDLRELALNITKDMKELELRMTIKLGGIVIGSMSLLVILLKLFKL
jgi:hypothetical protein